MCAPPVDYAQALLLRYLKTMGVGATGHVMCRCTSDFDYPQRALLAAHAQRGELLQPIIIAHGYGMLQMQPRNNGCNPKPKPG
jgi:hypothetical protein